MEVEDALQPHRIRLQHVFEWPRRAEEGEHAEEDAIDDSIRARRATGERHIQRTLVRQPVVSRRHLSSVGQDLGVIMVREGFAWAFTRFSVDYVDQQEEARRANRGVHAHDCVPAWEWRAQQRTGSRH